MKQLIVATTKDQFVDSLIVRREVFCLEQGVTYEEEFDLTDKGCITINGYDNGTVVATGRIRFIENGAKFERICVLKESRNNYWGRDILQFMLKFCLHEKEAQNIEKIILGSQVQALGFYEKFGFVRVGELFYDAGIPHYKMIKEL